MAEGTGSVAWLGGLRPCVLEELDRLGWYPERSVDVSLWVEEAVVDGFVPSDIAVQFWRSFGGMELTGSRRQCPLVVDPTEVQGYQDSPFCEWPGRFGQQFCPIGEWNYVDSVFIGSEGMMLTCLDGSYARRVADTPAEALHAFLCGGATHL